LAVEISMKELLEAGVHFGHQTRRWNPKMKEYIFGERNGIHIIDLQKTLKMFREAARYVTELSAQGRSILFVGTKRQAQEAVAEEAKRCSMHFVNNRWLGGALTNWATLQKSLKRLREPPSGALITLVDGGSLARDLSDDRDLSGAGDDVVQAVSSQQFGDLLLQQALLPWRSRRPIAHALALS